MLPLQGETKHRICMAKATRCTGGFDRGDTVMKITHDMQDGPSPLSGLMGEKAVRESLWPDAGSRPSRRWFLELKARGLLPYRKIGRRVFFCPEECRAAIDRQFKINVRRL